MKLETHPLQNKMVLEIPYDLVSTRIETLNRLSEQIAEKLKNSTDYCHLILNLCNCSMIDSAGLNYLISLHKITSAGNCSFKAENISKNIRRTFIFSRLDQYIEMEVESK